MERGEERKGEIRKILSVDGKNKKEMADHGADRGRAAAGDAAAGDAAAGDAAAGPAAAGGGAAAASAATSLREPALPNAARRMRAPRASCSGSRPLRACAIYPL